VRSSPIDVRAGAVSSGVRIVLPQGGTLVGHVYGPDGAVSGVRLRFDAVSSVLESKSSAVSDDTGEYRLDEAPAGPFTLRAEKDGLRTKLVSGLYVSPGATVRQDVTLSARDGNTALELGGIGAGLVQTPAGLAVRKLFSGDPAAVAGLREGDLLVRVDGEPVEGMSMADVLARVRGEPGTTVGIAVQRPETGAIVETVIVRAKVVH
jgi:S1-C subfamily serine protease